MPELKPRSAARLVPVGQWRRLLRERVQAVDWRTDLALAVRAWVTALLAASGYALGWIRVMAVPAVSSGDVALAVACVVSSVVLFAGALRLSGARDPWLGGLYVAALTVLAGAWLIFYRGLGSVSPSTWMGAAGCAAIIYVMGHGHPTKHQARDADNQRKR